MPVRQKDISLMNQSDWLAPEKIMKTLYNNLNLMENKIEVEVIASYCCKCSKSSTESSSARQFCKSGMESNVSVNDAPRIVVMAKMKIKNEMSIFFLYARVPLTGRSRPMGTHDKDKTNRQLMESNL